MRICRVLEKCEEGQTGTSFVHSIYHVLIPLAFWQRKYYDYNCRTKDIVLEKIDYCHNNPVVRGLVVNPKDWEWSICRWYLGNDDVLIKMDKFE